jgi:hypothetical protein
VKTNRTPRISLNTPAKARAYLEARGVEMKVDPNDADRLIVVVPGCYRCGGSGNVGIYWVEGGVCFACGGRKSGGTESRSIIDIAKRERAAELKAAKRERKAAEKIARKLEGQRAWCEKNGHGRITFEELDAIRAAKREEERAQRAAVARFVGEVGERVEIDVFVERVGGFSRDSWSGYGTEFVNVYNFRTLDGTAAIVCFTTSELDVGTGEITKIRATVKKHDRYKGEPQTTVKRVTIRRAA